MDLLFSCPPYFDLEVYSKNLLDASNQKEYTAFLDILENAFTAAIGCLKDNRFAVVVVGDIRDKAGVYRQFPDDVKDIFRKNGLPLYNEMILVESLGTLPQRASRSMTNRKVMKCHQNVLVFYKGKPKDIQKHFEPIEFAYDEGENLEH
jgi:DNA modification methylase